MGRCEIANPGIAVSLPIDFLTGADADLRQVFNKFEDYRYGLGVEFMMALEAYLARIATFPEIAPNYFAKVRRQVMRGFPYGIFYISYPTRIVIIAILDLRQDPQRIRKRLLP
jgi:toxin ParE1/3/4